MPVRAISDPKHRCVGGGCPDVYATDYGTVIIVGKRPSATLLGELNGRIGDTELAVEIEADLLQNLSLPSKLKSV